MDVLETQRVTDEYCFRGGYQEHLTLKGHHMTMSKKSVIILAVVLAALATVGYLLFTASGQSTGRSHKANSAVSATFGHEAAMV